MRLILMIMLFQLTIWADSFYVKYNPSVTGDGSAANPWGTLDDINWNVIPDSSSIHLKGTFKPTSSGRTILDISKKSSKVIIFKAWDSNNKPVFDGNGDEVSEYGIEIRKADYITVQDITFRNFSRNPVLIRGNKGQRVLGTTIRHCTFEPLKIKESNSGGISYAAICINYSENTHVDSCTINYVYDTPVAAQTDGLYSEGNINNSYVGNTIHIKNNINNNKYHIDCIQSYQDEGLLISKNSLINESSTFGTHQNRQGIYTHSIKNLKVINNNIVLSDGSSSIAVIPDKCYESVMIYNNTIVSKSNSDQQLYIEFPKIGDCNDAASFKVYNNLFYKQGESGAGNSPVAVKLQNVDKYLIAFNNNLYFNASSPQEVGFEEYTNNSRKYHEFSSWKQVGRDRQGNVGNPSLSVPDSGFNYKLSDESWLCVDKGALNIGILEDLYSIARPQGQGLDVGAFEFTGSLSKERIAIQGDSLDLGNYPNPFNPQTIISFSLVNDSHVKLLIYDILGQVVTELLNEQMTPGKHQVTFNALGIASGVYVYTLEVKESGGGNFLISKKMIVSK